MSETKFLSTEHKDVLCETFQLAATTAPEAVGGVLVNWLKAKLGGLFANLVAAVKAGNVTPEAIIAFLQTIPGVTIPSWLPVLLQCILPLILSLIA